MAAARPISPKTRSSASSDRLGSQEACGGAAPETAVEEPPSVPKFML
jgi:hypothetical protein